MNSRVVTLALHLGIFFVLTYGYENYVAVIYEYEGYVLTPNKASWYIALLAVILLSLLTPVAPHKPSSLLYQLTLIMVLLPMLVLFYAEDQPLIYMLQVLAAYGLCVALPLFINITAPNLGVSSEHKLRRILFSATVLYVALIFLMGGARYLNFDFSKVYDFRNDAADNLPGLFGYISPLVSKVMLPIAFVLSLLYRKYMTAAALLCFAVLIFGLTSHKSVLFTPFLILFIYLVSRGDNLIVRLNVGLLMVLLVGILGFWYSQELGREHGGDTFEWIGSLTIRRTFFVPTQLNYMYYDFFSKNDLVLFSNSKLTLGLVDYKYPLSVTHLIGKEYFDNEVMGANTGWFGSGYMQAGFWGLLLYGAIIGLMFKYIDACARNSGERALVTAAVVVPVLGIVTNSDLPIAFFTHGLYLNLLLIACFKRRESSNAPSAS